MILSLDVSTSTVGISLFSSEGKLLEVSHYSPKVKTSVDKWSQLYEEAKSTVELLSTNYDPKKITKIIIEEPLVTSTNINVATLLNYYAGIFYTHLKYHFSCDIIYYSIDYCRRTALPELIDPKKKMLWSAIPAEIEGVKKAKLKKDTIMFLVAQRYPEVQWMLNRNSWIDEKNYDRADSIVVGLAYFITIGVLQPKPIYIEKCIKYLEELYKYHAFLTEAKKVKEKDVKNEFKARYLQHVFEIQTLLNVKLLEKE